MKEADKLERGLTRFSAEMLTKLIEKAAEGYRGWDNSEDKDLLVSKFLKHVFKPLSKENLIDIANLAMFLWLMERSKDVE